MPTAAQTRAVPSENTNFRNRVRGRATHPTLNGRGRLKTANGIAAS
ncbi:hypothetical protein [Kingella potus]|nr:hypothetical protein [Kingella potus]UOP01280.1 hypothetical protein LVJ84_03190 [Kingella potus]